MESNSKLAIQLFYTKMQFLGRGQPRGPTPYPFIYHFGRKGAPFIDLLLKKGTPFAYLPVTPFYE